MAEIDALELLHRQHEEVDALFDRLAELQGKAMEEAHIPDRKELADSIVKHLSIHSGIEQEHFYPEVSDALSDGEEVADHSLDEHREIERLLAQWDGMSPDNVDFDGIFRGIVAHVREHVREEEEQIFPRLRERVDAAELRRLGGKLVDAMGHAPTHPHPGAPKKGTLGKVAAAGASAVDRARDTLTGR